MTRKNEKHGKPQGANCYASVFCYQNFALIEGRCWLLNVFTIIFLLSIITTDIPTHSKTNWFPLQSAGCPQACVEHCYMVPIHRIVINGRYIISSDVVAVPGSSQRMLEKARDLAVDCVVYDLEDSVTPAKKIEARSYVRRALDQDAPANVGERAVRINSVDSGLALADLMEVVSSYTPPPRVRITSQPILSSNRQIFRRSSYRKSTLRPIFPLSPT